LSFSILAGSLNVGYIEYADDIILLSASVCDLQSVIDICYNEGAKFDIIFNASKSFLFKIGKVCSENINPLNLGSQSLVWVDRLKYLGVFFVSSKELKVDISVCIRKCYASANAIFKQSTHVSEEVKLRLIESFVLPILTYAIEALNLTKTQCQQLNVCWNNMFRKIFHFNKWDSVKTLQLYCQRLDFHRLYHLRKLCFVNKLSSCYNNPVIHYCGSLAVNSVEFNSLYSVYELSPHSSLFCVKMKIQHF